MDGMKLGIPSREYIVHSTANHVAVEHSFEEAAVCFVNLVHGMYITDVYLIWADSNNGACLKPTSVYFWVLVQNWQHLPYFS